MYSILMGLMWDCYVLHYVVLCYARLWVCNTITLLPPLLPKVIYSTSTWLLFWVCILTDWLEYSFKISNYSLGDTIIFLFKPSLIPPASPLQHTAERQKGLHFYCTYVLIITPDKSFICYPLYLYCRLFVMDTWSTRQEGKATLTL